MERKFEWRDSNGQEYLYAQGQSRYDLGYAIGQGLHRQISAARKMYQAAMPGSLDPSIRELISRNAAAYQREIPPEDMEEIRGMLAGYIAASGEGMGLDELALQSFGIDLMNQAEARGLADSINGCTNFACVNADGTTAHGQNYDSKPKLAVADAFVHQRVAGEPEAFLYRPGGNLGMAVGKNEAGVCMTVSIVKTRCPAPIMTPRSVLVRRALRQERSIQSLRAMVDSQGRSPFSYNLVVSDAATVSGAQAIPAEQRICQVKRALVQSNQFDSVDWIPHLRKPSYSKKRQLYSERLLDSLLSRYGGVSDQDLLEILADEPVICRKKIQDGLGTTVLFFTRESFGRGNPSDQPAGRIPF